MKVVESIRAQPRLIAAALMGVLLCLVLPGRGATRLLLAWDGATGLYLALTLTMMARSDIRQIRSRAAGQDEGGAVILGLISITALVSLAGVMAELGLAKALQGRGAWRHVGLAGATVLLSWTFLHAVFAVHYAHEFYARPEDERGRGLEFPGHEPPDYWDFAYYAFVIGTACATADVNISSRRIRKITTLHCVVAFFFNTIILALAVNIGASFI